jgi:ATP-dependent Lon protease
MDQSVVLPVLPLPQAVIFPGLATPLAVQRACSVSAIEAALGDEDKLVFAIAQREPRVELPRSTDLYSVGCIAAVRRLSRAGVTPLQVMIVGSTRAVVETFESEGLPMRVRVRPSRVDFGHGADVEALRRTLLDLAARAQSLAPREPREGTPVHAPDIRTLLGPDVEPSRLAYALTSIFATDVGEAERVLEADEGTLVLERVLAILRREVEVLELRAHITSRVEGELDRQRREVLLREQLRVIQSELGEDDPEASALEDFRARTADADAPDEVRTELERVLRRLATIPVASQEYSVLRAWVELVLDLPWNRTTGRPLVITEAQEILDADHFDLDRVKRRILEQLAVIELNPKGRVPTLCFVGPPGVGKTSLGESIARALGRRFERLSLGGVHDEAELRGHRRTYVGAMPGRIVAALRRAGACDPVIMLDEVDKLGRDFRGDPSAALLEILDPAQNHAFRDNYLDLPFDLSRVLFLTTANTLDTVPAPLLDRLEVLHLAGYTTEEKLSIARRYLVPRQLSNLGLDARAVPISEPLLRELVGAYTREAGVRQLERVIGAIVRHAALERVRGNSEARAVAVEELPWILGRARSRREERRLALPSGTAPGLAWTPNGGEVIYIEAVSLPEGQGLTLTGQLGTVMQESAKAALSWVWSAAELLRIEPERIRRAGVHVHVPSGSTPKDGPSAGLTIAVALASLFTAIALPADVAMTGEITLAGLVLPVGGLVHKLIAAREAGMRRVLLPRDNLEGLIDVPPEVKADLELVPVDRIEDAMQLLIMPAARLAVAR